MGHCHYMGYCFGYVVTGFDYTPVTSLHYTRNPKLHCAHHTRLTLCTTLWAAAIVSVEYKTALTNHWLADALAAESHWLAAAECERSL